MKNKLFIISLFVLLFYSSSFAQQQGYVIDKLLFSDQFEKGFDSTTWITEIDPQPVSKVYIKGGQLVLDTKGGVTVWLNKLLTGNIMIEYKRTILSTGKENDRVSDLNNFWMASDPRNKNLFTRNGVFEQYDSLQLYYAGMGGNTNATTRFRKYEGNGKKPLLQEYSDTAHLLKANKEYKIRIVVEDGSTQYYVDDVLYFHYKDPQPLQAGYFGFRSTKSRQVIDDVKVYSLK